MSQLKATINSGYLTRLAVIAGLCLFWGGWSLYDGLVRYPVQRQMADAYQAHVQAGQLDEWPAYATQRNWPITQPPARTGGDIMVQYILAGLTLPVGLIFAGSLVRSLFRWIAMDEHRLTTSWGQQVDLEQITELNKERWEDKGIAVVHFRYGDGQGMVVLDDWRYDRVAIAGMVDQIDMRLAAQRQVSLPDQTAS